MTTTLHLRGPADVLALLPYQLGFRPHDSLVVVALHGTRMGLVQRIDLPPEAHVGDAVTALLGPLARDDPSAVLLVGFEREAGDASVLLEQMAGACVDLGLTVVDRLVVHDGRWRSLDCRDRSCCPDGGRPVPGPGEHPGAAEFVGREVAPLPDREALVGRLAPSRPLLARAAAAGAERWRSTRPTGVHAAALAVAREQELALWAHILRTDDEAPPVTALGAEELGVVAASLTDVEVRDALVAWTCPGTLSLKLLRPELVRQMTDLLPPPGRPPAGACVDPDAAEAIAGQRLEQRLVDLCAALPDEWAVAPLTVLASYAWWRGDGALTRVALDRALEADPGYRLATLLERMVDLGIRPTRAPA